MPQKLDRGEHLIRISPRDARKIEYSTDGGRKWVNLFSGDSLVGDFYELIDNGDEILAQTSKGLYYTIDEGGSWKRRSGNGDIKDDVEYWLFTSPVGRVITGIFAIIFAVFLLFTIIYSIKK